MTYIIHMYFTTAITIFRLVQEYIYFHIEYIARLKLHFKIHVELKNKQVCPT